MTDHLTTRDTGHYAGVWYDLPDGTKRYYTEEHIAHMNALHARHDDTVQVADAIDTVRANKGRGTINPFVKTAPSERKQPTITVAPEKPCAICGRMFRPISPTYATCGAESCKNEHHRNMQRQHRRVYDAKRRGRAT